MKPIIKGLRRNNDGEVLLDVELTDEFESWFLKNQGLDEWSDDEFETWMKGLVNTFVKDNGILDNLIEGRGSEQIDIWDTNYITGENDE